MVRGQPARESAAQPALSLAIGGHLHRGAAQQELGRLRRHRRAENGPDHHRLRYRGRRNLPLLARPSRNRPLGLPGSFVGQWRARAAAGGFPADTSCHSARLDLLIACRAAGWKSPRRFKEAASEPIASQRFAPPPNSARPAAGRGPRSDACATAASNARPAARNSPAKPGYPPRMREAAMESRGAFADGA